MYAFTLCVYIVKQTGTPKIMFKKRLFVVGEKLIANCTTTRARPAPHITWLINGKKVNLSLTNVLTQTQSCFFYSQNPTVLI